ncbi:MAG: 3-phosphoshikimate 1-carboxyvinyltransferase [Oscillospiraceae bacterium]
MIVGIQPCSLAGTIAVPPSKSMAHRMLICAALAGGVSAVRNLQYSLDISTTIAAMRQLGAQFAQTPNGQQVTGAATLQAPKEAVFCAESGSTLRFIIPLFALTGQPVTFAGAARLMERPLGVYQQIFEGQGLPFAQQNGQLTLQGPLQAGNYALAGNVSSQFISGLLLALPLLAKSSTLRILPPFESSAYVELTRRAQALFGVHSEWQGEHTLFIPGGQAYTPANCTVEGDWSQAAVPAVLAAVRGGIAVAGLNADSAQGDRAALSVLQACGAEVGWQNGLLRVQPPAEGLHSPGEVDLAGCPDLGPILCTLALFCKGTTRFVNAGRLRIKESDRIATIEQELTRLGGHVSSGAGSIAVEGGFPLTGTGQACSHNDHRVVMALTAAALGAGVAVSIHGAEAICKSWPSFFDDFSALGADIQAEECPAERRAP